MIFKPLPLRALCKKIFNEHARGDTGVKYYVILFCHFYFKR